jgi:hypothetical protein
MIYYITLYMLLAGSATSQLDPTIPSLCSPTRNISIERFPESVVDISDPLFYASATSHSYGQIRLLNKFSKSIQTVTAIIDYIGPGDEVLLSIPFRSTVGGLRTAPETKFHPEIVEEISEAIQPGAEVVLTGVTRTTTATCPVASRLTFLEVTFADGSRFTRGLPDWSFPPSLMDSPFFLPAPPPEALPTSSTPLRLRIDASGQVTSVTPTGRSEPSLAQYASEVMKNWTFYPALKNGQPVATELAILLRVNKQPEQYFLTRQDVASPVVAIQVTPWSFDKERWRAWYGDRPASKQSYFGQEDNTPSKSKRLDPTP